MAAISSFASANGLFAVYRKNPSHCQLSEYNSILLHVSELKQLCFHRPNITLFSPKT